MFQADLLTFFQGFLLPVWTGVGKAVATFHTITGPSFLMMLVLPCLCAHMCWERDPVGILEAVLLPVTCCQPDSAACADTGVAAPVGLFS